MSIVLCYPHTSASQFIGNRALAKKYNILMFMPTTTDLEWGEPIMLDLEILAARSGDNSVQKIEIPDFSDPNIKAVFFPSLGELLNLFAVPGPLAHCL